MSFIKERYCDRCYILEILLIVSGIASCCFISTTQAEGAIDDVLASLGDNTNGFLFWKNDSQNSQLSIEEISSRLNISAFTQVHDGKAHEVSSASLPDISHLLPREAYIITSNSLPHHRYMTSIGNGHVGTVIDSDTILMNGFYNGFAFHSRRARIPSFVSCGVGLSREHQRTYTLNMMNGVYLETIFGSDFIIEKKAYAHRQLKYLMVTEIDVIRVYTTNQTELTIFLTKNRGRDSHDLRFDDRRERRNYLFASTHRPETHSSGRQYLHIFYDNFPSFVQVPVVTAERGASHMKWVFYATFAQTWSRAKRHYQTASRHASSNYILESHINGWHNLWKRSRITLEGDLPLARAVSGALYYILSSMQLKYDPADPFIGLSPSDLAHGSKPSDYLGHVFWDQETWMYPGILMLFPDLAKLLLRTRLRTLTAAQDNARLNRNQGAQFPWEIAYSGSEVCPGEAYARNEIHISGDISFAFRQYMFMTKDLAFYLLDGARELVNEISVFWASRVSYNPLRRKYEILSVMPPDESKTSVHNSVYTNYIAKLALLADQDISSSLNIATISNPVWQVRAKDLMIVFDRTLQYHPEYDGYRKGTLIKQADVILLGFPLMMDMPRHVRQNDLLFYDAVTIPNGPAMTWSMSAIGWLELGEHVKAHRSLMRNMRHIHQPFQVWSEQGSGEGGVNFITGMGGLLQAIIFGYGGFRIKPDSLEFNPSLPEKVTNLTLTGISYQEGVFCFSIQTNGLQITMTSNVGNFATFKVILESTRREFVLGLDSPIKVGFGKGKIVRR